MGSPVLDISLLIYCCADTKTFNNVTVFLEVYYDYLTKALANLGVASSDVFCFNKLAEHWKKYSKYGLIFGNYLLKYPFYDAEEAPDFSKMAENENEFLTNLTKFFKKDMINDSSYIEKVRNNLLHYINNRVL